MIKYSRLIKKEKKKLLYGNFINHNIKEVVGISFEKYCKEYIKALV
jgi:hypothetical protein